jgi:hypothetical protein
VNRNLESALAVGIAFAAALIAVAAISFTNAHAADITVDKTPSISGKSRAEASGSDSNYFAAPGGGVFGR